MLEGKWVKYGDSAQLVCSSPMRKWQVMQTNHIYMVENGQPEM